MFRPGRCWSLLRQAKLPGVRLVPHILFAAACCLAVVACTQQPVVNDGMRQFNGAMPADFSGSWERDYTRGDDVNAALRHAYNQLPVTYPDQGLRRSPVLPAPSSRDVAALTALARLAELITRMDQLTISQNENLIRVDRKDDFSYECAFYDGVAKGVESVFGTEICGWDGPQLVSHLVLPGGLQITNRLTISANREQLRIVTTVASNTSRVPFTLRRFYRRYDRLPPDYNCVETLSMKRVCSTGELVL